MYVKPRTVFLVLDSRESCQVFTAFQGSVREIYPHFLSADNLLPDRGLSELRGRLECLFNFISLCVSDADFILPMDIVCLYKMGFTD